MILTLDKKTTIEDLEKYLDTLQYIKSRTDSSKRYLFASCIMVKKITYELDMISSPTYYTRIYPLYTTNFKRLENFIEVPETIWKLISSPSLFQHNLGRKKIVEFLLTKLKNDGILRQ